MLTQTPHLLAALQQGISDRLHIGAQVYASIDNRPVIDLALGLARPPGFSELSMQTDTLNYWLSAGKPVTAVAIAMLAEKNRLAFDNRVADFIPEFATRGKETITLRHCLTHTAGFRVLDTAYPHATWDETLAKICNAPLEREWLENGPGSRAAYHTHSSWYILGEIINRLTGQPHYLWIRDHIFLPLHMPDCFMAMSPAEQHQYAGRIGILMDTSVTPNRPLGSLDTPLGLERSRPSASCRGPMRQLARFYEMLLNGGTLDGVTILSPDMVHQLTSRQRIGMPDLTFRKTIDWGLGFILNSSQYGNNIPYQFGPAASPNTFGHGGSQSSAAFCDPEKKLVACLLFNGCPGELPHNRRLRPTLAALYTDLFPA